MRAKLFCTGEPVEFQRNTNYVCAWEVGTYLHVLSKGWHTVLDATGSRVVVPSRRVRGATTT